jgi:uncharacterized protein (DUF488 family)
LNGATLKPILTIGHSTRGLDEFLSLLKRYQVELLLDVRSIPKSARFPHFHREVLSAALGREGIVYRHCKNLGGLRKPVKDSTNKGWRNGGFRGFADYMQTEEFGGAADEVLRLAALKPVVLMCAEALPWRCHRSLIADALVVRHAEVHHIVSRTASVVHQLTPFALVEQARLIYPQTG